jgi:hypothetical protein
LLDKKNDSAVGEKGVLTLREGWRGGVILMTSYLKSADMIRNETVFNISTQAVI